MDASIKTLKKRGTLHHEGDPGTYIGIVSIGLLKAEQTTNMGKKIILELYTEGDIIGGEVLGAEQTTYQDTVSALTEATVTLIPKGSVPVNGVTRRLLGQFRASKTVRVDSHYPVQTRICRLLLSLGARFGSLKDGTVHLDLPLLHEDYAAMIGASRVFLTNTLSELKEKGALTRSGRVYALNLPRLAEISEQGCHLSAAETYASTHSARHLE